jgi:ribonuclease HIII
MQPPTISINEARKLLGAKSKHLTDNQVLDIIINLEMLAKKHLYKQSSKKYHGGKYNELNS